MDVKITFLHGDLEEEIYMKQPDDFHINGKEDYVCKLIKSLYGKSVPRIDKFKKQSSETFAMKDMRVAKQILGLRIICDREAKKL
ncbi:hypothetical protein CR513_49345, partial [Mucuna pruriens]